MEAFELVRAGKLAESQAIITGAEYVEQKQILGQSAEQMNEILQYLRDKNQALQRIELIKMISIILVIAFLFVIVIYMRKIVESKNIQLQNINAELAHEIVENQRARKATEAATQTKSLFLANMSHEIRTPLNAILGYSQIMQRDQGLSKEQHKNLDTIGRSGEHLLGLLNDILEMSKIETGRIAFSPETFDLISLLDDLRLMFKMRAEAKNLLITFDILDDLPRYIYSDEGKLRQVLINLLGNAIKFTKEGGIALRVKLLTDHSNPEGHFKIVFEVEDTGIGIATEEVNGIFEAFVQSSSGRKSGEGTGLGLAISQEYAHLLGGDITVTSEVGHGSLFRFEMETEYGQESTLSQTISSQRVMGLKPGQGEYRALIVDDRDTNRDLLSQMMTAVGFCVKEAVNGQEAIDIYQDWNPQLILMDLVMPVMDGRQASARIKQIAPASQVPVIIAVTASVLEDERDDVLSEGADDFIRKPFREADLFERIRVHLGVDFEYEDLKTRESVEGSSEGQAQLRLALNEIPPDLRSNMLAAIEALDTDRLNKLILQITTLDQNQSEQLQDLVDNLDIEMLEILLAGAKK